MVIRIDGAPHNVSPGVPYQGYSRIYGIPVSHVHATDLHFFNLLQFVNQSLGVIGGGFRDHHNQAGLFIGPGKADPSNDAVAESGQNILNPAGVADAISDANADDSNLFDFPHLLSIFFHWPNGTHA